MVKHFALIAAIALAGCQTTQDRLSTAKTVAAIAKQPMPKPVLPASCTALMDRVKPKADEPWVITQRRWEYIAENRDRLATSCGEEWDNYWQAYTASIKQ